MINLFHIPNYTINTADFDHYLHGSIVDDFEESFCDYVGAKYACSLSSATNAIFLLLLNKNCNVSVPSMIPPVVCNAIITSNNNLQFSDNTEWVGNSYVLHEFSDYKIIDSAQKVERDQFKNEANCNDVMFFSFYPTKPVGGSDGGIVVSNDFEKIKHLKEISMNGMSYSPNNWEREIKFPGFKMYMNSIQAHIAQRNLLLLEEKKEKLSNIKVRYNTELGYNNTSDHLYTIEVKNRDDFLSYMKQNGVCCGIHYHALHKSPVYKKYALKNLGYKKTIEKSTRTVSIPYNESLNENDLTLILSLIKKWNNI
jgi:dTDP-4-amino-4,6-dideoxygalactose transaminase